MCACVYTVWMWCSLSKHMCKHMCVWTFFVFYRCVCTQIDLFQYLCLFVSPCVSLPVIRVFVVKRWGANNRAPNSFKRRKSNNINKTAVSVTRVTFAVTGDRHRRGTYCLRISLKSASNCAIGLEVLSFLPLGVAAGQMHSAFSETLARIRPISWTGVKGNQSGIRPECGNFELLKHWVGMIKPDACLSLWAIK